MDLSKIQKYRNICPVCMQLMQVQGHLKLRWMSDIIKNLSEFFAEKAMKFRNEILAGDLYGRWNIMKISCPKFDVDVV